MRKPTGQMQELTQEKLDDYNTLYCWEYNDMVDFIKEPVDGFCYDLLYDMAQEYGHAELVWYALNGTRMIQGVYTDQD